MSLQSVLNRRGVYIALIGVCIRCQQTKRYLKWKHSATQGKEDTYLSSGKEDKYIAEVQRWRLIHKHAKHTPATFVTTHHEVQQSVLVDRAAFYIHTGIFQFVCARRVSFWGVSPFKDSKRYKSLRILVSFAWIGLSLKTECRDCSYVAERNSPRGNPHSVLL